MRLKLDVIVAGAVPTFATRDATKTIPIVFVGVSDPVGVGFAASLAKPGGNLTGLSALTIELHAKRLELFKETVPAVNRIGVLTNPSHPMTSRIVEEMEAAGKSLKIPLDVAGVRQPDELDHAFEVFTSKRVGAVIVTTGPWFVRERKRIAELALRHRFPTIMETGLFAEAGGLLGYGTDILDMSRRSASFVDKILRGQKPGDIPVEQPTKFDLVINTKTARLLGLKIPNAVLGRADRIVE